jgi:Flp pilus assembly protein CpaB
VKRSNRLVILVGVLLAVLAFVGIVIILNQPSTGGPGQEVTTVNVVVATEDIDIGEPVTPDKGEILAVQADGVEQTRIADPSLLTGRPALVPILSGEQITQEKAGLISQVNSIEESLQPGEKAVAFQVDRVTGLDFLIQAGDHIDIVLAETVQVVQPTVESLEDPEGPQRFETIPGLENAKTVKTILQDRRVLYVSQTRVRQATTGTASPGAEGEEAPPTQLADSVIIVFAGNDQDAEVIKFAQNDLSEVGALTAVLRRTEDTDEGLPEEVTTGITIDILFETYGIPIPDIIIDLGPEESPAP